MTKNYGMNNDQIADREEKVRRLMTSKMVTSGNAFSAGQAAHAIGRTKRKESYTREQGRGLCEYLERIGLLESHSDGKKVVYFLPSSLNVNYQWVKPNDIPIGRYYP